MKRIVFVLFTFIFLICLLTGCKNDDFNNAIANNSITSNIDTEEFDSTKELKDDSQTISEPDEELVEKLSNQLSSELNISDNALYYLASCLSSVNVTSIKNISEIDKIDNLWKIKIVDEYTGDFLLVLDKNGFVNLIYKDSFDSEPIYYEYDTVK